MTPEQIVAAREEVEDKMYDDHGNGPWLEIADQEIRRHHLADQALIIGYAIGATDEAPDAGRTDPHRVAWNHLLDRFNKRLEGVHGFTHPGADPVPRPASVVPGGGGVRRRSRHR